jgi:23S rRNA (uracil1939-C5)-methyltransferase
MQPSDESYEVEITGMVYGGDAMGRLPDGRAVFVPFCLPGERVRLRLIDEKRGHARAALLEVLETSPARIQPRCRHYGVCGGCHYQHLDYPEQLKVKSTIFTEQLERIAGLQNPPVKPIVASPAAWNYRNTVQFHLDYNGKLGYQEAGSHRVVAVSECHLPEEEINAVWPQIDMEPVAGLERVGLRLGEDNDMQLVLESSLPKPEEEFSLDMPISAVHLGPDGPVLLAGDPNVVIEVNGRLFQVSAGAFFQVNKTQAGAMVDHLLSVLPLTAETVVADIYSGVGLFSAFIAPRVKKCIGIELSEPACEDYVVNLDAFDNVELYVGAAEDLLPALKLNADIVIVDPPRSGVDRKALDAIAAMKPHTIAYISCDPSTLARDIKRLYAAGYVLEQSTPFDLFPQTFHIESISILKKNS